MDTAIQPVTHRATAAAESMRAVPTAQTLSVAAVYNLSETGGKHPCWQAVMAEPSSA